VALERHNPVDEFDTNFRRHLKHHLKQGGAPVTPCVGFDADAASAYLERALDVHAQTQFESHLAGCAACRRQVIGLARLSNELEAVTGKPPIVVVEPVWSRWYGAVTQWFDFSGWNRGWTAAAATACGLLLTVVAATTWQQLSAPQSMRSDGAVNSAPANAFAVQASPQRADVPATQVLTGQESEAATSNAAVAHAASLREMQSAQADQSILAGAGQSNRSMPIPPPNTQHPVLSSAGVDLLAVAAPPEVKAPALEMNFGTQPAPTPPGSPATLVGFSASNSSLVLNSFGSRQTAREPSRIALQPSDIEKKELFDLPAPRRASEETAKPPANEKPSNDRQLANVLKGRALGFMPLSKAEARTKEADVKEAKEQLKPLMKHLNGHTFYFERGFWIDEEYKSDLTLPLVRLTRGNALYQQTLIENPTLEQFFQLGQVIVVWRGKIYEVRKQ
jgi:hypothetical protein